MPKKTDIVVKESNIIARARIHPAHQGVWEERIIAHIVAKNRLDDTAFKVHKITVNELADKKRLSTVQHMEIKKAVFRLIHSVFEIPTKGRGADYFTVFAKISIDDDGNIEAMINPVLKPHYLELTQQFALRALPEFRALASTYSQILFRYLNSWKNVKEGEKTATLEELHDLLSAPESFRKNFKEFRKYALEVAHREITDPEKTSLWFDWEPIREGLRKVVAVRFIFNPLKARRDKTPPGEKAEQEEFEKLRSAMNACYEKHYVARKKECAPKLRSERCKYCLERGRMRIRQRQLEGKK